MPENQPDPIEIASPIRASILEENPNAPNPFESPQADMESLRQMLETNNLVKNGFKLILASCFVFGSLGAVIGLLCGVLVPEYYQAVFNREAGEIVEWKVGLGLGLTQGVVIGVVVGCVVLLSAAWYKSRIRTSVNEEIGELGKSHR